MDVVAVAFLIVVVGGLGFGRPGEVWGALSGQDRLFVARTR